MPGFDGTGPRGMGPMTGGGRGFCSPWGIGAGRRGGRGTPYYRGGYPPYGYRGATPYDAGYAPGNPWFGPGAAPYGPEIPREEELDLLKNQAEMIREQLGQIEARINELAK